MKIINFKLYFSTALLFLATAGNSAWGFVTYSDESNWQSAAGSTVLENFQGYSAGVQVSSLPALGVGFNVLDGGGYPATYLHHENNNPHGTMHLGNFPNGIGGTNQWNDITLYVLSGYEITALGYWNGDGQADTLVARVYDASDVLLGTVGAYKGNFAGFIADAAIAKVVFDGLTGDGWNHLDGLQTNVVSKAAVPEPASIALMGLGLAGLGFARRKKAA